MNMKETAMNSKLLTDTANSIVGGDKGLLAMDESNGTAARIAKPAA